MARRSKRVYVLMFDEDGSGEVGEPQAVFRRKPSPSALVDYVPVEDAREVMDMFHSGHLWWKSLPLE